MARNRFKLQQGETCIEQGDNEIGIVGKGATVYLWIGGKGCYGTLSGMKTLETLAAAIYRACGYQPAWMKIPKPKARGRKKK